MVLFFRFVNPNLYFFIIRRRKNLDMAAFS